MRASTNYLDNATNSTSRRRLGLRPEQSRLRLWTDSIAHNTPRKKREKIKEKAGTGEGRQTMLVENTKKGKVVRIIAKQVIFLILSSSFAYSMLCISYFILIGNALTKFWYSIEASYPAHVCASRGYRFCPLCIYIYIYIYIICM